MKGLILGLLALTLSVNVFAGETRVYKKTGATTATVTIKTEETDSTQAAVYVDAQENKRFIQQILKDPKSPLAILVKKIETENCEDPTEGYCGSITMTDAVGTSFGRGGWMSAGATYSFFVGYTEAGTGHFFAVSHIVTISESAEAQTKTDGDMEYSGVVLKTLSLDSIKEVKLFDEENK